MRIRYRYARSLLAGFLAVVLLFSLVPAASAAQQNSYHDPAENWKEALDRTNELDANAVVTHETFDCAYCNQARDFIVYRTPEYPPFTQRLLPPESRDIFCVYGLL